VSGKRRPGRPRLYARQAILHVRCDAALHAEISRAAKVAGVSLTQAVLHLVRVGLRKSLLTEGTK